MTLNSLWGIFLLGGGDPPKNKRILCVASLSKLNASRLVRDSQGLLRARLGARTIRRRGRGCVRLQRGAARASGLGLPARVAHPAQDPRRARTGLRPALRAGATAARLTKHRPLGPAARAGIQLSTSCDPARGRARAHARRQHRHFRIQSPVAVGRGARARPGAKASSLVREVHRSAAVEGLARAARLRAHRRTFRLLRPALFSRALARAFRLHGEGGRPLVADLRRGLCGSRVQAQPRRAAGPAGMARQARREESPGSGDAEAKRTACRKTRTALTRSWFVSTPTGPARATPGGEAGAPFCRWAVRKGSYSAVSRRRPTIAWSSPRSSARWNRSSPRAGSRSTPIRSTCRRESANGCRTGSAAAGALPTRNR